MVPHERSLVNRLVNKPFVLLGINSDEEKRILKTYMFQEGVTWRSWWDRGIDGPITKMWNVHSWPRNYVLDEKGIIRFKNVYGERLDRAVDALLRELDEKSKK
jgi:hypothetical protein